MLQGTGFLTGLASLDLHTVSADRFADATEAIRLKWGTRGTTSVTGKGTGFLTGLASLDLHSQCRSFRRRH